MSTFQDQTLSCVGSKKEPGCGMSFLFTAGEQDFYARKGFSEVPKRCPACRARRKAQQGAQEMAPVAPPPPPPPTFWEYDEERGGGRRNRGRRR